MSTPTFYHNICVKHSLWGRDFLSVTLGATEDDDLEVSLRRYCVPGRVTTYRFDMEKDSLRFYAEPWMPMDKALTMLRADLDKAQVVEMIRNAFAADRMLRHYGRDFRTLMEVLAPKSLSFKAFRKLEKALKASDAQRHAST